MPKIIDAPISSMLCLGILIAQPNVILCTDHETELGEAFDVFLIHRMRISVKLIVCLLADGSSHT